jgi:glycosyltransferase involved in cell wall biosynthesis
MIPGAVGGTEVYLESLLDGLAAVDPRNEYFLYVNAESTDDPPMAMAAPRFHVIKCDVRARFRPWRILWEQSALPKLLRNNHIDVLLNPGFTAPLLYRGPSVTVFHDLQHKRHPEFFRWFDLPFWNLLLWASATRSSALIAVSQATADDLELYYPGSGGRTTVIHHGVDPEFFRIGERRSAGEPPDSYILTVSTLHPHKNLGRLLEAFRVFRDAHPEFRLVIAGLKGFATGELMARREELGLTESVRFTGWIPRSELYELFERATAYIAPSEFEGFGMPVLEALAAGIPCASSSIRPFDEVAGSAAKRFDPRSVPEITAAMEVVAFDQVFRSRAGVAGPARAREFDWNETARLTLRKLEQVAEQGGVT